MVLRAASSWSRLAIASFVGKLVALSGIFTLGLGALTVLVLVRLFLALPGVSAWLVLSLATCSAMFSGKQKMLLVV